MVHSGHGVADFCLRHASEQYKTCSQFLAQDLRQVISRPHTRHGLEGKFCLLPLNDCACFMGLSWGPSVGCHRCCGPTGFGDSARHSHVHDGHSTGVEISVHGLWTAF
jgi:hypothetical protein